MAAEATRRKAINEKLASIKEELRVTYSNLANDFEKDISSISQRLGAVEGELEGQLELVKSLLEQLQQLEGRLVEIKDADMKCEEAGLDESEREYTVYTIDDLTFDLEVVRQSLIKKESFIENQVRNI